MELTSCACVCVPVACETQLRMFDLVFPCVRVAVQPYIGFTDGMVVSRCWCVDLDPVTLEGCFALCAAYLSACIPPSFVVPVRFGCVETAVSKKYSYFCVCVCFGWCVALWVFRSWLRSAILFGCNFGWCCWKTGVSNGVHAVLLNNLLARSGHRLSFRMPLGPLIPPLLCTNS